LRPVYIAAFEAESFVGADLKEAVRVLHAPPRERFDARHNPQLTRLRPEGYFSRDDRGMDHFWSRMESCIKGALETAGLSNNERSQVAIVTGSTSAQMPLVESRIEAGSQELLFADLGYGYLAQKLGEKLGMGAPRMGVSLACASSAGALIYASELIAAGVIDHAVVLGVEMGNRLTLKGFEAMGLLGQEVCQPFGLNRSGMILGEGCAAMVLSSRPSRWRFLGGSLAGENHGVTAHDPEGVALGDLMADVLQSAGRKPEEIALIKAHAAGGENSDLSEARALKRLFGPHLPPVSALKPYVGHTLGACGVLELALLLGALEAGFVPGQPTAFERDPQLEVAALTEAIRWGGGAVLAPHLAFGGMAAALLIEEVG
jgi:3-oxoacyl-[acyl-carrier-protein] synthase-1